MFKFKRQTRARLDALEEELKALKEELSPKVLTSSKKDYGTQGKQRRVIKNKNVEK